MLSFFSISKNQIIFDRERINIWLVSRFWQGLIRNKSYCHMNHFASIPPPPYYSRNMLNLIEQSLYMESGVNFQPKFWKKLMDIELFINITNFFCLNHPLHGVYKNIISVSHLFSGWFLTRVNCNFSLIMPKNSLFDLLEPKNS